MKQEKASEIIQESWKEQQKALRLKVDILKQPVSRMGDEASRRPWKGIEEQAALEILNLSWHFCPAWVQSWEGHRLNCSVVVSWLAAKDKCRGCQVQVRAEKGAELPPAGLGQLEKKRNHDRRHGRGEGETWKSGQPHREPCQNEDAESPSSERLIYW